MVHRVMLLLVCVAGSSALRFPSFRKAPRPSDQRAAAEAATPAGREKLAQVQEMLSDTPFISAITKSLPSAAGNAATPEELAALNDARAALPDDRWVASSSDDTLLRFARADGGGTDGGLSKCFAETSAWRARVVPPAADRSWEFGSFFAANADRFQDTPELGELGEQPTRCEHMRTRDGRPACCL